MTQLYYCSKNGFDEGLYPSAQSTRIPTGSLLSECLETDYSSRTRMTLSWYLLTPKAISKLGGDIQKALSIITLPFSACHDPGDEDQCR